MDVRATLELHTICYVCQRQGTVKSEWGYRSTEESGFEFGFGGFLKDMGERTSGAEKTKMSKSVKARKFENFGAISKYYIATVYRE